MGVIQGKALSDFGPPTNELGLNFPALNDRVKFHQIRFKIAITGAMTDRQTDRETDRHTNSKFNVPLTLVQSGPKTFVQSRFAETRFAETLTLTLISANRVCGGSGRHLFIL